jgi:hypothetical protein
MLFPQGNQLKHEANHSPPSSAKVKKAWSYTSTPHTSAGYGTCFCSRDNFTVAMYYTYTGCNKIRYTTLKICDETNRNITTQLETEHLLTLQAFLQVFSMVAPGYSVDIHMIF